MFAIQIIKYEYCSSFQLKLIMMAKFILFINVIIFKMDEKYMKNICYWWDLNPHHIFAAFVSYVPPSCESKMWVQFLPAVNIFHGFSSNLKIIKYSPFEVSFLFHYLRVWNMMQEVLTELIHRRCFSPKEWISDIACLLKVGSALHVS